MQKNKILLLGNIEGSYRTQYLMAYLAHRNYDFAFSYLGKWGPVVGESLFSRAVSALLNRLYPLIYLFFLPTSTHVLLLPMNDKYDRLFQFAQLLGKHTIMDFYSSRYVIRKNAHMGQTPISQKRLNRLKRFDRNVALAADELVFLNRGDANYYLQEIGLLDKDLSYRIIPLATPERSQAALKGFRHGRDYYHLCWWGKAARVHGIGVILEAAKQLKAQEVKFHLTLLEIDPQRAAVLEEKLAENKLEDVASVRFDLSFANGLEDFLVENCDIALGSFGLTDFAKVGLSNKIVDALSMGIPMVTTNTDAIQEFGLEKVLSVCDPVPEEIVDRVLELIENKNRLDLFQQNAIEIHQHMFSRERFEQDLDRLFDSIDPLQTKNDNLKD
jgi:glycosyltransferase involved in cell wall biosynthesis